ncbi:hypothetical protein J8F10_13995 [Gemmata sp. G18]|uniref:Uncharacterized protein n=1 Tax=Gemmata palustris TaxID=2822762 RepID=A0ABS5BRP8_9BACT|nr:hypothetical protein [Gemmata palustris]MBP3956391.1 hypothetical protein [Gemmata palustris]
MSDPFSTAIRRYMPWPEYRALKANLSHGSLIERADISRAEIDARLATLRNAEEQWGFVYLGERQWLERRLEQNSAITYGAWVGDVLENTVFYGYSYETSYYRGKDWNGYKGHTDDLSLLWLPPELPFDNTEFWYVNATIAGDKAGIDNYNLCHLFDIIHDLSYYLNRFYNGHREHMSFGDIRVLGDYQWQMWTATDYGHVPYDFCGQARVPFSESSAWLTPNVTAIAESIDANRAFDQMPILADALEEAGCDDGDVLDHFRHERRHTQRCLILDWLLGKK